MIKLSFIGEGPSDIGRGGVLAPNEKVEEDGFLQIALKRLLEDRKVEKSSFEACRVNLKDVHVHGHRQKKRKQVKNKIVRRLIKAIKIAEDVHRSDGMLFVVDDATDGAMHCEAIKQFVTDSFSLKERTFKVAAGAAVKELKAVLFADPEAAGHEFTGLETLLKEKAPEMLRDPKGRFFQRFQKYVNSKPGKKHSKVTADVARYAIFRSIDLEKVKRSCSVGLGPFIEMIEQEILPLFT